MASRKSVLRGVLNLVRFLGSGRCPVLIVILVLLLPTVARAQAHTSNETHLRQTRTSHWYCSSDMGQSTMYFSAAFDVILAPGVPDLKYRQMDDAFKQTIEQKYGYKGNAVCFGDYKTLAAVQADEQKRISEMRASKKWKVIETGWTYNGAPAAVASSAPAARPVNATAITGVYNGNYRCAHGPVNLKLTLVAPGDGSLTGIFTFDLPANFSTRTASYTLNGTYDAATGEFRLEPVEWEPPAPANYVMVGMDGAFNSSTEQVSGKITYPTCTTFEATRNKTQSAALPHHPAVTPASPAARTNSQLPSLSSRTGATRATAANSSPVPQATPAPVAKPSPAAIAAGQSAFPQSQNQAVYFCFARYQPEWKKVGGQFVHDNKITFYRSPAFQASTADGDKTFVSPLLGSTTSLKLAWFSYLVNNYTHDRNDLMATCEKAVNDAAAKTRMQGLEQGWVPYTTTLSNPATIVHLDWKYVPGQDVPLQPKVIAENTKLYYCSGFLGTTPNARYFSDNFAAPDQTDINRVRDDFVRFIKEKYSPQSHEANGGCGLSNKAEEETPMRAAGQTIIETGWKPKTFPKAANRP